MGVKIDHSAGVSTSMTGSFAGDLIRRAGGREVATTLQIGSSLAIEE